MDECSKQFEEWVTDNGQWPSAADKRGDNYRLQYMESAWIAWQAAWNRRAEAVPEGYKLVPIEPTEEMVVAGWDEYDNQESFSMRLWYKAMLAAAPKVKKHA